MNKERISFKGHLFQTARVVTIAVGFASPIGGIFMESGSVLADNSQPTATHEPLPSPTPTGIIGEPVILTPTPPQEPSPRPTSLPEESPTPSPSPTPTPSPSESPTPTPTANIGEPWSMTPFPTESVKTPSYIADIKTPKALPRAGGVQENKIGKAGLAEAIAMLGGLALTLPGIELLRRAAKKK